MNGEIAMDEMRKDRELERIFGDRLAVGFPKRRSRAYFWLKLLAACVAVCLVVAVVLTAVGGSGENGFWGKLCQFAFGNGFIFDDKGFGKGEETTAGENSTEGSDTEIESSFEESKEESSVAESTDESETVGKDESGSVIAIDLSEAEKGDGHVINYSDRTYDAEGLLEMGFHAEYYPDSPMPTVLILHTHTSEGYADFDPNDPTSVLNSSVVAVGDILAAELNRAKIPTVHCSVIHDDDGDAYQNAAETIETMMKIYPTIEYVIDLHRMELTDADGNVVKTYSAEQTAQVRITVSAEGVLSRGALSLALCLRRELNEDGARVCMPTVLTDSEYNAASALYYLKLDVGSLGNSSDEAHAAAILFAEAFAEIILG